MSTLKRRPGYGLLSLAACISSVALHLAFAFIPGLPALSVSTANGGPLSQLSGAMSQLWVIEATVLGAVLVAMFFAFTSVKESDPPSATLDALLADIGFNWTLAVFTSALVGSCLTTLMLQVQDWAWPITAPSVGALPLLDFALFAAVVYALIFIVSKSVKYLYPSAIHGLTLQRARRLAAAVASFEHKQEAQPSRLVTSADGFLSFETHEIPPPPEVGQMRLLFSELEERGSRAIVADDPERLYDLLDVLREALRSHYQPEGRADLARTFHESPLDEQSMLSSDMSFPVTPGAVERIIAMVLHEFNPGPSARCTFPIVWFPFSIWADGREMDSHRLARLGLELAAKTYWAAASKSAHTTLNEWIRIWREHPHGPESYITNMARPALQENSADDKVVLHHLLSAHEIFQCSATSMCLALLRKERNGFFEILNSIRDVENVFWPVKDKEYEFSPLAKALLRDIDQVEIQSLLILAGFAGVRHHNGDDLKPELDYLFEVIKSKSFWMRDEGPQVVLGGRPRRCIEDWYFQAMTIGEGGFHYDNKWNDDAYLEDAAVWGSLLYLSASHQKLSSGDKQSLSNLMGRRTVRSVCERIASRDRTRQLFSADLLALIDGATSTRKRQPSGQARGANGRKHDQIPNGAAQTAKGDQDAGEDEQPATYIHVKDADGQQ